MLDCLNTHRRSLLLKLFQELGFLWPSIWFVRLEWAISLRLGFPCRSLGFSNSISFRYKEYGRDFKSVVFMGNT
jgi:hypothetical protein